VTARDPGATFKFAVLADSHIEPRDPVPPGSTVINDSYGFMESTLAAVTTDVAQSDPDFIVDVGDLLDYHLFGFNTPPPDASWARLAYLNFRRMMGDTLGRAAHFTVIGNWDGENGCNAADEIDRSLSQRLLYLPGPTATTYPQGGSPNQDYYAFTWGDALFVVLNVMTYTPTCHLLDIQPGLPDSVHPPRRRRQRWKRCRLRLWPRRRARRVRRRAGDRARPDDAIRRSDLFLRARPRVHGHGRRRHPLHAPGQRGRAVEVRFVGDGLHQLLAGFRIWARHRRTRRPHGRVRRHGWDRPLQLHAAIGHKTLEIRDL
jgi:hypothetical protein